MNFKMIRYLLGIILLIEGSLMLLPMGVSLVCQESIIPFAITVAALVAIALPCVCLKPKNMRFYAKEGFVTVAAGWILLSIFGALPFVISGSIPNFINALFETVSGFTTTGSTILEEIEGLPRGILFWRSFTHWIGGMGVLVFILAILPSSGGETNYLMRAEVPGPQKGKLVPKMKQTALILYGIYIAITIIQLISLMICGLSIYDAAVTTFATAGTGGFSVLNDSIAGYGNHAAEWVIAVFMMIFGVNFNIYFFIIIGKLKDAIKSEELKWYLGLIFGATVLVAINTARSFSGLEDCIRTAFFQVASITTTTGYVTTDYNFWPSFSKMILLLLTVMGACAGSTAGGLKISRVLILTKTMAREIKHILRPRSVNVVKLDGEAISDETVRNTTGYFAIYVTIIIGSVLLISVDGFDFETTFTAVLTCINNVGPGLGAVGPVGNFSAFSLFSKVILSLIMLIGRLEIMPMIILFSPIAWRKH